MSTGQKVPRRFLNLKQLKNMKLFEKQRCESAFILLYADVDQAFKKNMYPDSDFMSQNDAFWKKHFVVFNY
jgi:hypothetical protein